MPSIPIAVVDVIDPRQLLPPREGSLILVLGGTAVLVLSLTFALAAGRTPLRREAPTPSVGPRPKRSTRNVEPASASIERLRDGLTVHEIALKTTARAGVGTPQIVTANPGPHALVVLDCLTCSSADRSSCRWKREQLEQALRQFVPGGRVVHVSCDPEDTRPCIFELRTGDVGA